MAIVFLEGGLSPIPMQMASTELHRGPHSGVCQFRRRTQGLTKLNQTQFIAEYGNFCIGRHHAIEISPENDYQKITMTTVKANKLAGSCERPWPDLHILPSERFLRDTAARLSRLREADHGGSENFLTGQQGKVSFGTTRAHRDVRVAVAIGGKQTLNRTGERSLLD
jgi:hypothetical protein